MKKAITKEEQMFIELAQVREYWIQYLDEYECKNPFTVWYSPRKGVFSCHFLGMCFSAESQIALLTNTQRNLVVPFNALLGAKCKNFQEVVAYANAESQEEESIINEMGVRIRELDVAILRVKDLIQGILITTE